MVHCPSMTARVHARTTGEHERRTEMTFVRICSALYWRLRGLVVLAATASLRHILVSSDTLPRATLTSSGVFADPASDKVSLVHWKVL